MTGTAEGGGGEPCRRTRVRASAAWPSLGAPERAHRCPACAPVAGLRTRGRVSCRTRPLLAVASRARCPDPVRRTAVVPAHRCGAVPVLHRVPSCDAGHGCARRTTSNINTTSRTRRARASQMLCREKNLGIPKSRSRRAAAGAPACRAPGRPRLGTAPHGAARVGKRLHGSARAGPTPRVRGDGGCHAGVARAGMVDATPGPGRRGGGCHAGSRGWGRAGTGGWGGGCHSRAGGWGGGSGAGAGRWRARRHPRRAGSAVRAPPALSLSRRAGPSPLRPRGPLSPRRARSPDLAADGPTPVARGGGRRRRG